MINFVNANVTDTWPFPARHFHALVTSPPYWAQRQYATSEWDGGDPDCNHSPGAENRIGLSRLEGSKATQGHMQSGYKLICAKCGAVRGDQQLGLEEKPDCLRWAARAAPELHCCFVCNTRIWAREAWRVLRDDGTLWLNLGDSYNGSGGSGGDYLAGGIREGQPVAPATKTDLLQPGDLIGIPWRVALALQADGWILRSDVIWNKAEWVEETGLHNGTTMPGSLNGWRWERCQKQTKKTRRAKTERKKKRVRPQSDYGPDGKSFAKSAEAFKHCEGCDKCKENDGWILRKSSWRPTTAHEFIFQFVKQMGNYADREAVKAPAKLVSKQRAYRALSTEHKALTEKDAPKRHAFLGKPRKRGEGYPLDGSNLRDIWRLKRSNYSGSHFAVFPPSLPEICIKASTSEAGCCPECGSPWARVDGAVEYHRTCEHELEPVPCRVLDPFSGSGTTALVAHQLGRNGFGMDLSLQYIVENALKRTQQEDWLSWSAGKTKEAGSANVAGLPLFAGLEE